MNATGDLASTALERLLPHTYLPSRRLETKSPTWRQRPNKERNPLEEGLVLAADRQRAACEYSIVLIVVGANTSP